MSSKSPKTPKSSGYAKTPKSAKSTPRGGKQVIGVWFRKGLRLHDNHPLVQACQDADRIIPFFIMQDPFPYGPNRRNFLLECLHDLNDSLKEKFSSRLLFFNSDGSGDEKLTEKVLKKLVNDYKMTALYHEKDFDPWNRKRDAVAAKLSNSFGFTIKSWSGHTILDLQQAISQKGFKAPIKMTMIESILQQQLGKDYARNVPKPIPAPKKMPGLPTIPATQFTIPKPGKSASGNREKYFPGGETQAFKRMKKRVTQEAKKIIVFEKPRTKSTNQLQDPLEPDTTGLSMYISHGCLSVRMFWHEILKCYDRVKEFPGVSVSKPPMSLTGQLMFREQFYVLGLCIQNWDKAQNNFMCKDIAWGKKSDKFMKAWEEGKTGYPFIDALMRELAETGFMHHLGRHAVSCFLTRGDLWQSWTLGRDVFDAKLLDADWSLNNGNWLWLAGVAPFSAPYFRIYNPTPDAKSSLNPDVKTGAFIKKFIPELKDMPIQYLFEPSKAPASVQKQANCIIGKDYPAPIVDHKKARDANLKAFKESLGRLGGGAGKNAPNAKRQRTS